MRPHVELIQQADLCWHAAELPRGEGKVRQRNMSYDEENGGASTKLVFDSSWHRPAGYHHADTEWFLLSGEMRLGTQLLRKGAYFRAPAGLRVPALTVKQGTEVLLFRELQDWGFTVSSRDRAGFVPRGLNTASSEPGSLTVVDTTRMEWMPNIYEGDQQRFLKLKLLYHDPAPKNDPEKGFVTMMCWAPPGWSDDRLVHHPVFEEASKGVKYPEVHTLHSREWLSTVAAFLAFAVGSYAAYWMYVKEKGKHEADYISNATKLAAEMGVDPLLIGFQMGFDAIDQAGGFGLQAPGRKEHSRTEGVARPVAMFAAASDTPKPVDHGAGLKPAPQSLRQPSPRSSNIIVRKRPVLGVGDGIGLRP